MENLIRWLNYMEHLAKEFYESAGVFFKDEVVLSTFLNHLAEDEAWHYHAMGSAAELLRSDPSIIRTTISLDENTKASIEAPLHNAITKLEAGDLDKENLLSSIVEMEFSEWNDLFLYVANTLKSTNREFQYVAARIEKHKKEIETFIQQGESISKPLLEKIQAIPSIWETSILVVDDDPEILNLLVAILERQYSVATAINGHEALSKTITDYYDVIISDIEMPVMNGIDFYKQAVSKNADIGKNFLFFSSNIDKHIDYFRQNKVSCLDKPATINDIRATVRNILQKSP